MAPQALSLSLSCSRMPSEIEALGSRCSLDEKYINPSPLPQISRHSDLTNLKEFIDTVHSISQSIYGIFREKIS